MEARNTTDNAVMFALEDEDGRVLERVTLPPASRLERIDLTRATQIRNRGANPVTLTVGDPPRWVTLKPGERLSTRDLGGLIVVKIPQ